MIMTRLIFLFGSISGALASAFIIGGIYFASLNGEGGGGSMLVGYLSMLLSLSLIFLAVKRYRDTVTGGVVKFWPAFLVGLGVAAVAGVFYTLAWEIYFRATDGAWMQAYIAGLIEAQREAGMIGAELDDFIEETENSMALYVHWWFRMPLTFVEIFPVGILVSLIASAVLRNPKVLLRVA